MSEKSQSHRLIWWIALALLAFASFMNGAVRYDRGLDTTDPFISLQDIAWLQDEAFLWSQNAPLEERELAGYPPGIFYVHHLANTTLGISELTSHVRHDALNLIILWVSVVNALTAVCIALLGERLQGRLAGFLAAAIWIASFYVTARTTLPLTEAWQALFIILAALLAATGLQKQSWHYLILGVLAGLLAVFFKYSAFPALGFGTGATLWLMYKQPRRWWPVLIFQGFLIVVCAVWLWWDYGAINLSDRPEAARFLNSDIARLRIELIPYLIEQTLTQVGLPYSILTGAVMVVGSFFYLRPRQPKERLFWLILTFITLFHIVFIITYLVYPVGVMRYIAPFSALVILMMTLSLAGLAHKLADYLPVKCIRRQHIKQILLAGVMGIWLASNLVISVPAFIERSKPQLTRYLVEWLHQAVPEGTLVLRPGYHELYRIFGHLNPVEGSLRPYVFDPLLSRTLPEWRDIYVYYADVPDDMRRELQETEEGQALLDKITPLKHFPPESSDIAWRGEPFTVYYMDMPDYQIEIPFENSLMLHGYDITRTSEEIRVRPYWQASQPASHNYVMQVRLVASASDDVITQIESPPALPTYPPTAWTDPDEIVIGSEVVLSLPPASPADLYRVTLRLHHPETGDLLQTAAGNGFVELTIHQAEAD